MTYQEELIFGLVRWLIKGTKYVEKYDDCNQLISDELRFDALSYVILMVSEIAGRIANEETTVNKYNMVDFDELKDLKDDIFVGDKIDFSLMVDEVKDNFPMVISSLISNK